MDIRKDSITVMYRFLTLTYAWNAWKNYKMSRAKDQCIVHMAEDEIMVMELIR